MRGWGKCSLCSPSWSAARDERRPQVARGRSIRGTMADERAVNMESPLHRVWGRKTIAHKSTVKREHYIEGLPSVSMSCTRLRGAPSSSLSTHSTRLIYVVSVFPHSFNCFFFHSVLYIFFTYSLYFSYTLFIFSFFFSSAIFLLFSTTFLCFSLLLIFLHLLPHFFSIFHFLLLSHACRPSNFYRLHLHVFISFNCLVSESSCPYNLWVYLYI